VSVQKSRSFVLNPCVEAIWFLVQVKPDLAVLAWWEPELLLEYMFAQVSAVATEQNRTGFQLGDLEISIIFAGGTAVQGHLGH
jgi:hypothetical protein